MWRLHEGSPIQLGSSGLHRLLLCFEIFEELNSDFPVRKARADFELPPIASTNRLSELRYMSVRHSSFDTVA